MRADAVASAMTRANYSRWDGTQEVGDLSGDDVLRRLMDDLLEHGDPDQAFRRLMQQGYRDTSGRDIAGLRELARPGAAADERNWPGTPFRSCRRPSRTRRRRCSAVLREMLSELNRLVERRDAGEDVQPDFEQFMDRYGDLVPGNPANLDELLESLARQLAAASELLESLTPEQRAKLAELSEALLEDDLDLRMELERLAASLASASPGSQLFGLPFGLGPASSLAGQLSDLGGLEQLLGGAPSPGALAEVDIERARELLGEEDARSLGGFGQPGSSAARLGVGRAKGRTSPAHSARPAPARGTGPLRSLHQARPVPGRPAPGGQPGRRARAGRRDQGRTSGAMPSTFRSNGPCATLWPGGGRALRSSCSPADFEVERTEALSRSATVIMLDLSLSMPMRGNFLAAKKMAIALHALISSRFPSDYLGIVGFSRYAREVAFRSSPRSRGTTTGAPISSTGSMLSRKLLSRQRGRGK